MSQALRWVIGCRVLSAFGRNSLFGLETWGFCNFGVSVTPGRGWGVREGDPLKWPYRRDAMVAFRWKERRPDLRSRKVTLAVKRWGNQRHLWGGNNRGSGNKDEGQCEQGCPRRKKRGKLMVPTPAPRRAEGKDGGRGKDLGGGTMYPKAFSLFDPLIL